MDVRKAVYIANIELGDRSDKLKESFKNILYENVNNYNIQLL